VSAPVSITPNLTHQEMKGTHELSRHRNLISASDIEIGRRDSAKGPVSRMDFRVSRTEGDRNVDDLHAGGAGGGDGVCDSGDIFFGVGEASEIAFLDVDD